MHPWLAQGTKPNLEPRPQPKRSGCVPHQAPDQLLQQAPKHSSWVANDGIPVEKAGMLRSSIEQTLLTYWPFAGI